MTEAILQTQPPIAAPPAPSSPARAAITIGLTPTPSASIVSTVSELREQLAPIALERDIQGGIPGEEVELIRRSGLLGLAVPAEHGGLGESLATILWTVRKIAEIDGGLSRLFGYHLVIGSWLGLLSRSAEQRAFYYGKIIREQAWLGNATLEGGSSVLDIGTRLTREDDHFRLSGNKIFSTGAVVSDWLLTGGVPEELGSAREGWVWVLIPSNRSGIKIRDDWDPIGQKAAYSGSVELDRVEVFPTEVLHSWEFRSQSPFLAALILLFQIQQANTILGIGQGALADAANYTRMRTRPWHLSEKHRASQDPYIIERYGEFFTELAAAEALVDRAGGLLAEALEQGESLTWEQRGHVSAVVLAAKAAAARATLDVTHRFFETTGARSAATKSYGLDRYWRNARTETLHSPLVYHVSSVGNYVLNGEPPTPSFYS